jgi:hypothetical protein
MLLSKKIDLYREFAAGVLSVCPLPSYDSILPQHQKRKHLGFGILIVN